jgi:23S rRNA (adenine2503-C2)-methyltransferase
MMKCLSDAANGSAPPAFHSDGVQCRAKNTAAQEPIARLNDSLRFAILEHKHNRQKDLFCCRQNRTHETPMHDIHDATLPELTEALQQLGLPPFRARQLFSWLQQKQAVDFDQMTSLPASLRSLLKETFTISSFKPCRVAVSRDGSRKYVFKTVDGHALESVLIPEPRHLTLCISTQIGCAMGCRFCCTGQGGLVRNLRPGEIVGQVLAIVREHNLGERLPNIVYMGMGEPLANYEALIKSIRILQDENGLHYSHRKITVSTCGLVPGLLRLGNDTDVNLAISLNAPDDRLRTELMPINKIYPLSHLLEALRTYPLPRRKRITVEYILMRDVNDTDRHARTLTQLLTGIRCKINLIPFNEHPHSAFRAPDEKQLLSFQNILLAHNYTATIRRSKGVDIAAACGQLGRIVSEAASVKQ